MRFVFTKHALKRFKDFRNYGVKIARQQVIKTIQKPDHVDKKSDSPKIIVSKIRDETHILRVVFKIESDIIVIITFYPAKRGRYYENKKN